MNRVPERQTGAPSGRLGRLSGGWGMGRHGPMSTVVCFVPVLCGHGPRAEPCGLPQAGAAAGRANLLLEHFGT